MNDIKSDFIEPTDFLYNLSNWSRDNHNILYITGVSGSGKSRLSKDLKEKYDCKVVSLDDICGYYLKRNNKFEHLKMKNYENIKASCPEALEFLNNYSVDIFGVRSEYTDTLDIILSFCTYFESKYLSNGELYIIEGYLIHNAVTPEWFKDRPLIVKITDYETVVHRRAGRVHKDDLNSITEREIQIAMRNPRYKNSYDSYIKFVNKLN